MCKEPAAAVAIEQPAAAAVAIDITTTHRAARRAVGQAAAAAEAAAAVERLQARRLRIHPLSELWHFWMSPVMRARGTLTAATLPLLPPDDSAEELLARFRALWAPASAQANGDGRALRRVIMRLLSPRFPLLGLWQLGDAACNFAQPVIVAALVRDLRIGTFDRLGLDFALVVLLALSTIGAAISVQQVLWGGARSGMRAKIALASAVYAKTLHLSNSALLSASAATATNLVAIDVFRLEQSFTFMHMLWYAPVVVFLLGVVLGVWVAGLATLPGLVFLVVLFYVQRRVGSRIARLRSQIVKQTDRRVKLMHDVLAGSEGLKVHAWEDALAARVQRLRAVEERLVWRSLTLLSTLEALIFFAPGVATFLILITRYALDRAADGDAAGLHIEEAYAVLGLCNVLVKQFNVFPRAAKTFDEARVSFQRIERFLLQPEATQQQARPLPPRLEAPGAEPAAATVAQVELREGLADDEVLGLEAATATWGAAHGGDDGDGAAGAEPPFALHEVSLRLRRGEACVLVGEVGCGKSSLLQLLLGEMGVSSGPSSVAVRREGGVGYVPQSAWIVNASVRENIVLGRPADEAWYDEVVRCCALGPDLAAFAQGDATEIGERGVTVSGGQKARISLARALYGRPALLLLDDPLSAVDMHVAHTLVHEALIGLARNTLGAAVVLASHQLQFVSALADEALVLAHGRVIARGPPALLAEQGHLSGRGGAPAAAPASAPEAAPEAAPPADDEAPSGTVAAEEAAEATRPPPVVPEPPDGASKSATAVVAPPPKGPAAPAARPKGAAASEAEMGRGNKKGEALRFYVGKLGAPGVVAIVATFLGLATCRALADWSLGRWINDEQRSSGAVLYASLTGATVCLGCAYALAFTRVVGAASRIHAAVLQRVLRAPKAFFDTTPLGLLVNVFSKDMDTLDELLPIALTGLIKCCTIVTTAILVGAAAAPAALGVMPLVWVIFRRLAAYFQQTAGGLKRIEKASAGPLFSLYTETLQGVTSIRAFGLQPAFEATLIRRLDQNHAAHFLWTASNRWFAARLDAITGLITLSVGVCVLLFRDHLEPSLGALALTYVVQTTSLFQWGFRMWAEVNNHFVSVERALSYTKLPQEPPPLAAADARLAPVGAWPSAGALRFAGVRMAYRPGLPLVLDGVDFSLPGGVKAAVVGRSGAGKSSLSVALLRLAPLAAGAITIDGVDISELGLRTLRRAVTFIQQDAMLFAGSLRANLDPFDEHTDAQLEAALAEVDWPRLSGSADGVAYDVAEGGANLSSGTRQLVMLARALLRGSRLLMLDEATANVDFATDAVMQRVVRSRFPRATILTIAHRLDTIIDYDHLLLMADGRVAEAGRPSELLERPDSLFSALVGKGPAAERLRGLASASGKQ